MFESLFSNVKRLFPSQINNLNFIVKFSYPLVYLLRQILLFKHEKCLGYVAQTFLNTLIPELTS